METYCVTNENLLDADLISVMGADRCKDISGTLSLKKRPNRAEAMAEPIDETWHPAKPTINWQNDIKTCVKEVVPCSAVSTVFFIWEQMGLVDPVIAMPIDLICAVLCGVSIGRHLFHK